MKSNGTKMIGVLMGLNVAGDLVCAYSDMGRQTLNMTFKAMCRVVLRAFISARLRVRCGEESVSMTDLISDRMPEATVGRLVVVLYDYIGTV